MVICPHCNAQNDDNTHVCTACGKMIPSSADDAAKELNPLSESDFHPPEPHHVPKLHKSNLTLGNFCRNFLSPTLLGVFLLYMILHCTLLGLFTGSTAVSAFLDAVIPSIAFCFAIAITVRANGPDFSLLASLLLAYYILCLNLGEGLSAGIIFSAFGVCILIGAINGCIIALCKIPAILTTLIMSQLVSVITMAFQNSDAGYFIVGHTVEWGLSSSLAAIILLIIAFILPCVLILASTLKRNKEQRDPHSIKEKVSQLLGYVIAHIVVVLIALYLVIYPNNYFYPSSYSSILVIIFVFACLLSAGACHGKYSCLLYGILPALFLYLYPTLFAFLGTSTLVQYIVLCILTALFLAIAFLGKRIESKHSSGESETREQAK